nr:hypothetical protein [Tanacetum cinerariifolium]
ANDAIIKNMQTNMTSLTNSNLELKNMFGQFMKMNTASSSSSETLLGLTSPSRILEGNDMFPVIIAKDLSDKEKTALITVLKSHKQAIAWKLSDIKGINPEFCTHKILMEDDFEPTVQHQRRVDPKIHGVIKKEVLKLLDGGLIYPISDSPWDDVYALTTREDTNLCLNWEKSYFMVKKGIVLGHKISKNGIEVDKAKVDVIAKLPHPTTVKESNYTTMEKEMLAVVYAFEKFRSYLIMKKSIVYTDHSALKYLFAKERFEGETTPLGSTPSRVHI